MKVSEIIFETRSFIPLDHLNDDEIINILEKECSDILKIYRKKERLLLRGEKKDFIFFKSFYPKNRKPKDSSQKYHDFLNNALKKAGFIATRENSVFVNPLNSIAKIYGNIYIFLPKNGFSYTWSEKIVDAYENFDIFAKEINKEKVGVYLFNDLVYYKLKDPQKEKEFLNKVKDFFKRNFVSTGDFFNFCINYYHTDYFDEKDWKIIKQHLNEYFIMVDENKVNMNKIYEIVSKFYRNDNLERAIIMNNEIMFTDSYYYMLSYTKDISEKIINFLF